MAEKMVRVYPHPRLAEHNEWLPGIGIDGAEVPEKQAQQMLEGEYVVLEKPAKPKAAPKPKAAKSKGKAKSEAPAEPAEKSEA